MIQKAIVKLVLFIFIVTSFSSSGYADTKKIVPPAPSSILLPVGLNQAPLTKVLILRSDEPVTFSSEGHFVALDSDSRKLIRQGYPKRKMTVGVSSSGLVIDGQTVKTKDIRLIPENKVIIVNKREYRFRVRILINNEEKLSVINELPLDEYLKGVLPREVSPRWNMEALKAQAVAARTFALFQGLRAPKAPFFLKSDVSSQVYGGKTNEHNRTSLAVDLTQGEILTYSGGVFPTFFHSSSGGSTTDAAEVWNIRSHPSLRGVKSKFVESSKYASWERKVSYKEIKELLEKDKTPVGDIIRVEAVDRDRSGRLRKVNIIHSQGNKVMKASEFRRIIGYKKLLSTLITFDNQREGLQIKGRGWGHGVGLSQWGAKTMADESYSYNKILEYFYPQSTMLQAYPPYNGGTLKRVLSSWFSSIRDVVR